MNYRKPGNFPSNAKIRAPKSPGHWVDEERCDCCGEEYRRFVPGVSFEDGVALLREANGGFESGGGWRSRGPVLWAMRVLKLEAWYLAHRFCPQMVESEDLEIQSSSNEPCPWCTEPCEACSDGSYPARQALHEEDSLLIE